MPNAPANFRNDNEQYELSNTVITFTWDPPVESDLIDYYDLRLASLESTQRFTNVTSPYDVTLAFNIVYQITLIATNCAGTALAAIPNFGKFITTAAVYYHIEIPMQPHTKLYLL